MAAETVGEVDVNVDEEKLTKWLENPTEAAGRAINFANINNDRIVYLVKTIEDKSCVFMLENIIPDVLLHALLYPNKKLDLVCHQLAKMAKEDYKLINMLMGHQDVKLCKEMLLLIVATSDVNDLAIVCYMHCVDGLETGVEFTCVLTILSNRLKQQFAKHYWAIHTQLGECKHPEVVEMRNIMF